MRVAFLGSQEIGARCLQVILDAGHDVVGVGSFEAGEHEHWTDDVERVVTEVGLPRLRDQRFRTTEGVDELRALSPDILFAIGWRWILPKSVLGLPPLGCLGIHGSLLPRLRGFAPVNWALIRDEPRTGPSLFYFDEGMDTGDLVGQRPFELTDEDDAGTVRRRLVKASVDLLSEHLPGLAAGLAPRTPQPSVGATYGERRRPEDGAIDWNRSAREIFNWVRGLTQPYPGAFTFARGVQVLVWRVLAIDRDAIAPGIVVARGEEVVVGAGAGAVRIVDAAIAGDSAPGAAQRAGEILLKERQLDPESRKLWRDAN